VILRRALNGEILYRRSPYDNENINDEREDWIESVMVYVDTLGIHCRRKREVLG
jgi:hypothetical protein